MPSLRSSIALHRLCMLSRWTWGHTVSLPPWHKNYHQANISVWLQGYLVASISLEAELRNVLEEVLAIKMLALSLPFIYVAIGKLLSIVDMELNSDEVYHVSHWQPTTGNVRQRTYQSLTTTIPSILPHPEGTTLSSPGQSASAYDYSSKLLLGQVSTYTVPSLWSVLDMLRLIGKC